MKPLFFEICGTPVAKPRMTQRDRFMPSKAATRYFAWAEHAAIIVRKQMSIEFGLHEPIDGPVSLRAHFYLPIPSSYSAKVRKERANSCHALKPDIKNLVASLEDALNGLLWKDDSQIYCYRECAKVWTAERQGLTQFVVFTEALPDAREA